MLQKHAPRMQNCWMLPAVIETHTGMSDVDRDHGGT
jgi:hypothetical protein